MPLVEAGKLDEAKVKWNEYLGELDKQVEYVIVGCTHYSFLKDEKSKYKFIDPADLVAKYFSESIFADTLLGYKPTDKKKNLDLEIEFSKCDDEYFKLAERLLSCV